MNKLMQKYREMPVMVKVTFWSFFCGVLQKGVSLITLPIFTRILTTEELGTVTSYSSWLTIFLIFTSYKLNYGVFNKGMSKFPEERDEYVSTMQTITSLLTLVFLLVYFAFLRQFNALTELPTPIMLIMVAEMFFTPAIWFWSLRERYDFKYKSVTIVTVALTILNPIAGLLAVSTSKNHAMARIISSSAVNIAFCIWIYWLNYRKSKKKVNRQLAKFAFLFNLPLIPHYVSEYILDQSDRIMIQKMCGMSDLGLYGVVYNMGLVIKIVVSSLNTALIPWLYRCLGEKQYDEIRKYTDILSLLILIPFTAIMLISPEVLSLLAPPEYQEAFYVVAPVTASVYYVYLFGIYGNIEFYFDKNKFTMYISVVVAVLNIILNYIFILKYGYIAAAYTTLFCYFVLVLAHCIFVRSITRLATEKSILNDRHIWIYSGALTVFSILINFAHHAPIIRYALLAIELGLLIANAKKIVRLVQGLR